MACPEFEAAFLCHRAGNGERVASDVEHGCLVCFDRLIITHCGGLVNLPCATPSTVTHKKRGGSSPSIESVPSEELDGLVEREEFSSGVDSHKSLVPIVGMRIVFVSVDRGNESGFTVESYLSNNELPISLVRGVNHEDVGVIDGLEFHVLFDLDFTNITHSGVREHFLCHFLNCHIRKS